MILFFKLLLAHLLGDFVLQPDSWVREKEKLQYKSDKLYLHGIIHFLLIIFLIPGQKYAVWIAGIVAISHTLIDMAKLTFQNRKHPRFFFFTDQGLHLIIIGLMAYVVWKPSLTLTAETRQQILFVITAIIFLLTPSSVMIRLILSKWAPATEIKTDKIETSSLLNAGMMIGFLERLLVFIFILAGQWATIGFLVTAKSVFRFSDLKIGQDRKLTEYILIGTLLSFGLAIVTGVIVHQLLYTS